MKTLRLLYNQISKQALSSVDNSWVETPKTTHWIGIARAAWWVITGLSVFVFLFTIPVYFEQLNLVCFKQPCISMQLNLGQAIFLKIAGVDFTLYALLLLTIQILVYLVNFSIGVFIFSRKSGDWLAIFVSLMLVTSIHIDLLRILFIHFPNLQLLASGLEVFNSILLVIFFYVFPTGSFRPRWTIALAGFWVLAILVVPTFFDILGSSQGNPSNLTVIYLISLTLSSLFVLTYRYRRIFTPTQRIQTKWVVLGLGLTWGGEVVMAVLHRYLPYFEQNAVMLMSWNIVALLWTLILPVSILIAVLSSALLDIDVFLRRTLSYSALTLTLLVIYFGSVLLLQTLFELVTGQRSALVSIVSTLVIAAMFTPLRRRIHSDIDRVFFRKNYNAEQAVGDFTSLVREDVDLEEVSTKLVGILRDTLQPEFLSLWLCRVSQDKDFRDENQAG